jgi:hypothetical protein
VKIRVSDQTALTPPRTSATLSQTWERLDWLAGPREGLLQPRRGYRPFSLALKGQLLLFLCLFWTAPCSANTLWVVMLPGTSLSDWQKADAPHLHEILNMGSVALMNTRTARTPNDRVRETPESAALTLGAGSRGAGGPEAADFVPQDVPVLHNITAGQVYTRRMGVMPPRGSLVNIQWPYVLRENAAQGYDLHLGNLADALGHAGVIIEAIGGPLANAVAEHGDGWVFRTYFPAKANSNQCVVWDAGSNIPAADSVLGTIMARLGNGRLIVLSPTANDRDYARGARLCPVAVWGRGIPPGLIFSASTRRSGLVTDTDVATTVGAYFGVSLSSFPVRPFGERAWEYRASPNAISQITALNNGALAQWEGMRALPYAALFLGLWMVAVTALSVKRKLPCWVTSVPPAVILALLVSTSPITLALWLIVTLACTFFIRPWGYALILGVLLVVDLLIGDPLMRHGLLGYSAIEGARYYGIGNEAMGPLIGACLIVADRVLQKGRSQIHPLVWVALVGVTALLGAPSAGAKAGGFVVALAAFGSYAWLRSGRRLSLQSISIGVLGIALLLLGAAFADAHFNGLHASHFGQAAARLSAGGFQEWAEIIERKLLVEGHLLWHSTWAVTLWGGLATFVSMYKKLPKENNSLFVSGLIAIGTCLAVNDAGMVAGALCLALLWSRLFDKTQQNARSLQYIRNGQMVIET